MFFQKASSFLDHLVPKITFLIHATYAISLQMARSKITSFKTHIGDGEHIQKFHIRIEGQNFAAHGI